jgi:hypothetical protein
MTVSLRDHNRRLMIIDDNRAIHDDFRKIPTPDCSQSGLHQARAEEKATLCARDRRNANAARMR